MNGKFSTIKGIALMAALVAGLSGVARADDNDMARLGGDSYAYFNNAPIDKSPSAWRQANPNGVSERQLQAESSEGLSSDFQTPTFDKTASAWRQENPHGLSERDLQALSSEGPVWHESAPSAMSAFASTNQASVVAKTAGR
jgi:hypothetical protein